MLLIKLVNAPNSNKESIRTEISDLENQIDLLIGKNNPNVTSNIPNTPKNNRTSNYSISYIRNHEEGSSDSSFSMTASSDPKIAYKEIQERIDELDSGFGCYVYSIYNKDSGKYLLNKNKGRGGYSIYDRY